MPSQLLESTVALVAGSSALVVLLTTTPEPPAVIFIGAIAAYTLGRQLVFPLRANPGHTSYGRMVMLALAGGALALDVLIALHAK